MEEGFLLGLFGSALGLAVGLPLALYLQAHGLEIGAFSQVLGTSAAYYFVVTTKSALTVFAAGILIAALGYLYGASGECAHAIARVPRAGSLRWGCSRWGFETSRGIPDAARSTSSLSGLASRS